MEATFRQPSARRKRRANSVFKLAYRFDDTDAPGQSADAVLFQWAVGF